MNIFPHDYNLAIVCGYAFLWIKNRESNFLYYVSVEYVNLLAQYLMFINLSLLFYFIF